MPDAEPREEEHKPSDEPAEPTEEATADAAQADAAPVPGDEVAAALVARFAGAVFHDSHGQPVVYLERAQWAEAAAFLRDDEQFTTCLDVTAVDHLLDETRLQVPGVTPERFEVVANFLSHVRNRRIRLITEVPESDATVPSLMATYPGVDFAERETFDLYGINFSGHPDMTRILMPDDWVGHPLRKDDAPARVPVTFKGDPGPR
jgi:NADH:ubiquinone oxidoreductase subunit C